MLGFWIFLVWLTPGVLLFVILRRKSKRSPDSTRGPSDGAASIGGFQSAEEERSA